MNILEETKQKLEEKVKEYKEAQAAFLQLEKDIIYLEGQMSVLGQLKFEEEKSVPAE